MAVRSSLSLRAMTLTALGAALLCAVAPWTLQLGPIPLSLCTAFLYLLPYVLGWKRAATAVLAYILLGAAGLPVFSAFTGGIGVLAGPTGGYIPGYILLTVVSGLFLSRFPAKRWGQLVGMLLGTALLYALGAAWYCAQSGAAPAAALALCVLPFLPGDGVKIAFALYAGPLLRRRMGKAGLLLP